MAYKYILNPITGQLELVSDNAGATGPQGVPGTNGAVGPTGVKGDDGTTGPVGPTGVAGSDGSAGPQGPTGVAGSDGSDGAQGPTGVAGSDGSDGAQGPTGVEGPSGPSGATGPAAYTDSGVLISTDGTLAGDSDNNIPTERAVKTYVDNQVNPHTSYDITGYLSVTNPLSAVDGNGNPTYGITGNWPILTDGTNYYVVGFGYNATLTTYPPTLTADYWKSTTGITGTYTGYGAHAGQSITVIVTPPVTPPTGPNFVDNEIVAGSTTSWTLANTPVVGSEHLFGDQGAPNGLVRLILNTDYTITDNLINTVNPQTVLVADYRM
jgi:hypothetical protein